MGTKGSAMQPARTCRRAQTCSTPTPHLNPALPALGGQPLSALPQRFLDQMCARYSYYPINDFRDLKNIMRQTLDHSSVRAAALAARETNLKAGACREAVRSAA
jgi:hypothetical protein